MLKKRYIFFIYIIALTNYYSYSKDFNFDIAVVAINDGIDLKVEGKIESKTILRIPFGSEVKIIKDDYNLYESGDSYYYEHFSGAFVKIQYQDKTGYVFEGFLENPASYYNLVYSIYEKEGALSALKKLPMNKHTIILWDEEANINNDNNNENPIGFFMNINGRIICDTGMGMSGCKLLDIEENKDVDILFTVKNTNCVKFKEYPDRAPDCLNWEILTYKFKLLNSDFLKLLRGRFADYNLKGKLVNREYDKNLY